MTDPIRRTDKKVDWCEDCKAIGADPGFAERHHDETGHVTCRREWTVLVWIGDK